MVTKSMIFIVCFFHCYVIPWLLRFSAIFIDICFNHVENNSSLTCWDVELSLFILHMWYVAIIKINNANNSMLLNHVNNLQNDNLLIYC